MATPSLLEARRSEIGGLCRLYGVRRLRLFGSAARGKFDEGCSDLDFLVELDPVAGMNRFQQFMRLKLALEDLLDRPVDLVSFVALRDPAFRAAAEREAIDLYAA